MKNFLLKSPVAGWFMAFLALAPILGFAPGGDSYKILVDGKVAVEQHVYGQKAIPTFSIHPGTAIELSVSYSHCGQIGSSRSVLLKDEHGTLLKRWNFADSKEAMLCQLNEFKALGKNGNVRVELYYASNELPEGKLLAKVQIRSDRETASRQ